MLRYDVLVSADTSISYREKLREQNALSDEIVEAMNSVAVGNQVDEDELEDELEQMQQEQLDEQMTKTGTVPVSDAIHKLPAAANGPRKSPQRLRCSSSSCENPDHYANPYLV